MTRYDLLVEGGLVHLPGSGLTPVTLAVSGGVVAAIVAPGTALDADRRLDATGKVVLPGAIDGHIHLGSDITVPKEAEEVATETRAAVSGGVTTVLGYLMSAQPYEELFDATMKVFAEAAYCDFGVHFVLGTAHHLEMLPRYVEELGVSTFKFFMNFKGDEGRYLGLPGNDDGFLYALMRAAAAAGAMVNPHTENIEVVWTTREEARQDPPDDPLVAWGRSRPPLAEAEAAGRAALFAEQFGTSTLTVHVSSALALRALVERRRTGPGVFIETCPHYLLLDEDCGVGTYGKVNPPLRTAADREALWAAIADGTIDVVGSDHVPRPYQAKEKDIWTASAGFPGVETLLPLMLSEGHVRRGVPLDRIVDLVSTTPAKLFGLYPRKGVIAVGADADLAVVDFREPTTLSWDGTVSAASYTPYDGLELACTVTDTVVRGEVAYSAGVAAATPTGRYVPRPASGLTALREVRDGFQSVGRGGL